MTAFKIRKKISSTQPICAIDRPSVQKSPSLIVSAVNRRRSRESVSKGEKSPAFGPRRRVSVANTSVSKGRNTNTSVSKGRKLSPDKKVANTPESPQPVPLAPGTVVCGVSMQWTVQDKLGSGGFGDVYRVICSNGKWKEGQSCALKTEPNADSQQDRGKLRLKTEVAVLQAVQKTNLQRKHFTEFIDRGKDKTTGMKYMVMSMLGPSIDDIRRKIYPDKTDNFTKSTVLFVASQTLTAIRDLHEIGYLHRDVKPQNFAISTNPSADRTIYVFDFGISRRLYDWTPNGKELRKARPDSMVRFVGTPRYASIRCHQHCEQGRKDDVESWLYMVYDLFDREEGLPWKKIPTTERNGLKSILSCKMAFLGLHNAENPFICDAPEAFKQLIILVTALSYETRPNYEEMLKIVKDISLAICGAEEAVKLDWTGKEEQLKAKKLETQADDKSKDVSLIRTG